MVPVRTLDAGIDSGKVAGLNLPFRLAGTDVAKDCAVRRRGSSDEVKPHAYVHVDGNKMRA